MEHKVNLVLVMVVWLGILIAPAAAAPPADPGPVAVSFGPNVMLSDRFNKDAEEPTIGSSPANPNNLVAGWFEPGHPGQNTGCRAAFTLDGGLTWSLGGLMPLKYNNCFDPSIAADHLGNFYYAYLDVEIPSFGPPPSNINVARSTDGGRTFSTITLAVEGNPVGNPVDKPFVGVDTGGRSRFRGTIYLAYTESVFDGVSLFQQVKVTSSQNGGSAWSTPVVLATGAPYPANPINGLLDALPVVAPDGTAYVFYTDWFLGASSGSIKFSKSRDGGRTWASPLAVASNIPSPGAYYLKNADSKFGVESGHGLIAVTYPAATVTPDGTLFVAWADISSGSCFASVADACVNSDVRLSISKDGGKSWTAPIRVSDDGGTTDQFLPWIAAHPSGVVSIFWLDKRLDPNNVNYDAFYTNTASGKAFLPNVRITTATSETGSENFVGHYLGMAAAGNTIHPVWIDLSTGTQEAFSARGSLSA